MAGGDGGLRNFGQEHTCLFLSSARKHGLENYPDLYTVNSAEATQIIGKAEDILRYMAYGPLSIANSEQITDDPDTYKMEGDIRGLPTALVYSTQIVPATDSGS